MRLETVAVDTSLLVGGVWWDFETKAPCAPKTAPHEKHFCVLVVPFGNEHARALDELRLPHLDEIRLNKGRLPDDVVASIRGAALARTVLKGWANAEIDDKPYPYSLANATELMVSARWTFIRKFVESAASDEHSLLAEEEAKAKGN